MTTGGRARFFWSESRSPERPSGLDSVDPSTWSVEAERVQQSLEEVLELASGLALLGAVLLRLVTVMDDLQRAAGSAARSHQGSGDSGDALAPTGQA